YRDSLSVALRLLRPETHVIVTEPCWLDEAVVIHEPVVVICSQLTPTVERQVKTWMVLYPEGETTAEQHVGGKRSRIDGIDLAGIAHLIDRAILRESA
ncbi:MAG TPA: hypothetical protein VD789_01065, partial [Thermomicrobiales bacterium]|nr:hypothetical protein [Thermomicrobiales bacterium]